MGLNASLKMNSSESSIKYEGNKRKIIINLVDTWNNVYYVKVVK